MGPGRRLEVRPRPLGSRKWPTTLMKELRRKFGHLLSDEDRAGLGGGTPSDCLTIDGSRNWYYHLSRSLKNTATSGRMKKLQK